MASPQKEDGYTSIANEIMEKLSSATLNGSEFRICIVVLRKTYGFNKKFDLISLSQFSKYTGLKRSNICETLKSLVVKRLLLKLKNGYSFNKNWEQWLVVKRLPPVVKSITGSSQKHNEVVVNRLHTKDIITKDTITKDISEHSSQDIVSIFQIFSKINPATNYGNTTQRKAIEWLIKEIGLDKTVSAANFAISVAGQPYAPVITTPYQLKEKLASLQAFYQKNNNQEKKGIRI